MATGLDKIADAYTQVSNDISALFGTGNPIAGSSPDVDPKEYEKLVTGGAGRQSGLTVDEREAELSRLGASRTDAMANLPQKNQYMPIIDNAINSQRQRMPGVVGSNLNKDLMRGDAQSNVIGLPAQQTMALGRMQDRLNNQLRRTPAGIGHGSWATGASSYAAPQFGSWEKMPEVQIHDVNAARSQLFKNQAQQDERRIGRQQDVLDQNIQWENERTLMELKRSGLYTEEELAQIRNQLSTREWDTKEALTDQRRRYFDTYMEWLRNIGVPGEQLKIILPAMRDNPAIAQLMATVYRAGTIVPSNMQVAFGEYQANLMQSPEMQRLMQGDESAVVDILNNIDRQLGSMGIQLPWSR